MTVPSDDDVNRLRIALARISRLIDRRMTDDGGLSRSQLSVLGVVVRAKSIKMSELAEAEGLNPTMLSRIVGRLEADGLVQREPGEDDRRAVTVRSTAAGGRLHTRLRRRRTRLLTERLAELPPGQAAALVAALPALESLADALLPGDPASRGAAARAGAAR